MVDPESVPFVFANVDVVALLRRKFVDKKSLQIRLSPFQKRFRVPGGWQSCPNALETFPECTSECPITFVLEYVRRSRYITSE